MEYTRKEELCMGQIDLTGKTNEELKKIIENKAEYVPEVVENAKNILELREHNEKKVMEVLNECSAEEPQNEKTENMNTHLIHEMLSQLKTIKNCVLFFTVLTVISIVITLISTINLMKMFNF